ncbi:MAG: mechanosensitive ion channel [Verrucomicrobiales bacterium]|nr:mechanosensitive ion channel [Verrucomicrobiales bacterium]
MKPLPLFILIPIICFSGAGTNEAQEANTPSSAQVASSPAEGLNHSLEDLQRLLDEAKVNQELDEPLKQAVTKRYEEAIQSTANAATYRTKEQDYRDALTSAPDKTKKIAAEIEALKKSEVKPDFGSLKNNKEISAALSREQAEALALKAELSDIQESLAEIRTRPDEIQHRLSEAKKELRNTEVELAGLNPDDTPANTATTIRLHALKASLESEIAMLESEALSIDVRETRIEAAQAYLDAKIAMAEARVDALRKHSSKQTSDQVNRAESLLSRIQAQSPPPAENHQQVIDEITRLIEETRQVSASIVQTEELYELRDAKRRGITDEFDRISTQFKLGFDAKLLAPALLENLRSLPTEWESSIILKQAGKDLSTARSNRFRSGEATFGETSLTPEQDPTLSPSLSPEISELYSTRKALREALQTSYSRYIHGLENLSATERQVEEQSSTFRSFAMEKVFWVRTSSVIGPREIRAIPAGFNYCYGPARIREAGQQIANTPLAVYIILAVLALLLFLPRPFYYKSLEKLSRKKHHLASDKYTHTLWSLLLTLLIALPFPALMVAISLALSSQESASEWTHGVSRALRMTAGILYQFLFLIALCRKNGLAQTHFRWNADILHRTRRLAMYFVPFLIISTFTLSLLTNEPNAGYLSGFGRIAALLFVVGGGTLLALLLHPTKGIAATIHRTSPGSVIGKLRNLWFVLAIAINAGLALLVVSGFLFTVILLVEQIEQSLSEILFAFVLYGMLFCWFAIRGRRIAKQDALEKRAKKREEELARKASEEVVEEQAGEELIQMDLEEEEEVDLISVSEQFRNFLKFIVGTFFLLQLYEIWANFGPVVEVLSQTKLPGGLSIVDVAFSILVIAITLSCIRNLPGILEILILSRIKVAPGTRSALITLGQYTITAIGGIVLFRNLGVDWAQFGWIAAALSVGLGFGLQEVVANFVSGIILLFERPIRVGDVVTVDGIDGAVSRIQIRATTITTWDRKEFIVPNKQFVTGTVLNWTRGNSINRILIPVGVAYGSNTEKARQILIDVATSHPLIMDDPPPFASFEEFGDSSLKIVLRSYLPDMDHRLATITNLHEEISRRFEEANIEIAFPQMDVRVDLRSN